GQGGVPHVPLPGARFGGRWGRALPSPPCPGWGAWVDSRHKFCPHCGNAVPAGLSGDRMPRPPISYTPQHLIERFLAARATIEGELKQATILFVDIVDSTRLTYGKDPEAANMALGPAIEVMRQAVFRYDGYVRPRGD